VTAIVTIEVAGAQMGGAAHCAIELESVGSKPGALNKRGRPVSGVPDPVARADLTERQRCRSRRKARLWSSEISGCGRTSVGNC
jgi:hypothetical protein